MLRNKLSARNKPETDVTMVTRQIVLGQPMLLSIKLDAALANSFLRELLAQAKRDEPQLFHSLSWLQADKMRQNLCSTEYYSVKIQQ